jgi:hypothetical protein
VLRGEAVVRGAPVVAVRIVDPVVVRDLLGRPDHEFERRDLERCIVEQCSAEHEHRPHFAVIKESSLIKEFALHLWTGFLHGLEHRFLDQAGFLDHGRDCSLWANR